MKPDFKPNSLALVVLVTFTAAILLALVAQVPIASAGVALQTTATPPDIASPTPPGAVTLSPLTTATPTLRASGTVSPTTATLTLGASETISPTTATPTAGSSVIISPTVTATPSPQGTPTPEPYHLSSWYSLSPDKAWVAIGQELLPGEGGGDRYFTRVQLLKTDGTKNWTIVDKWSDWGLGYTLPRPVRWSADGLYFYFTNVPVVDGCAPFVIAGDLNRAALNETKFERILPEGGLALSLSPDERTAADIHRASRGPALTLYDIATAKTRELALNVVGDNLQVGNIVWAPDNKSLLLVIAKNACLPAGTTHSLVRVNMDSLTQTFLLSDDPRQFTVIQWDSPDRVLLAAADKTVWTLDLTRNEVLPAACTPVLAAKNLCKP